MQTNWRKANGRARIQTESAHMAGRPVNATLMKHEAGFGRAARHRAASDNHTYV